ncbi:sensor histidine kinase [Mesorhizobium sp. IMUNJ 23232]|uniref:sensor histidine kinase n=1 Tax=Mesorhizobium sp. IMUNJ 23232 TaxID=3376064 RepID=UPI00379FD8D6
MAPPLTTETFSRSFTLRAAATLIAVMFVFFTFILGIAVFREWRGAETQAEQRALSASLVVSTNVRWLTQLSQQSLQRIDEALGSDLDQNAGSTASLVRDAVRALPGNVKSYVVSADGRTLFSTDPSVKPIDVRDREYFAEPAKGQLWYFSSLLVSRLDGAQIFVISKRLERRGEFAGVAIISFDVALFQEIWESLDFDDGSTVGLFRKDGQLVARYPLAPGPLDLSKYVLFTDYLKKSDLGNYRTISPADGVDRFVAYRRIPGTEYVALASLSAQGALAPFWRTTITTLFFAVPTALMLLGASIWIVTLLHKDQARSLQLTQALGLNELLVKDTHHRVKNNLQSIMSMIRMHALPEELKGDLQNRIAAMSVVHEHLYRLDQFSDVNAKSLIPAVIEPLQKTMTTRIIHTGYDIEDFYLTHEAATPLALLLNEVVTNSLKYGMPAEGEARLDVSFTRSADGVPKLQIADNGPGFDPLLPSTGLGARFIRALVTQLGGTFHYSFENGTFFEARLARDVVKSLLASREVV